MHYKVSYKEPHHHLLDLEFTFENSSLKNTVVHLPSWRPGRYELGNFAKNILRWQAFDEKGKIIPSRKKTKDSWEVDSEGIKTVIIKYNYYAYQLDAGACWLDESQLYINGVHCFLYIPGRLNEACKLELSLPESYKVAIGLKSLSDHSFQASDFHTLVDCPLIASNSLQHNSYEINGIPFNIWLQGECKPDWVKILKDFKAFTLEQLNTMGSFPAKEYHYLVQVLPYKMYHGVEHYNSTVIAIGPGYNLMKGETYNDFLGVNSHELFHAWNIKAIRPADMYPYDYSKENYSRLGYVAEGVTTYYGDLFLVRSGVFTVEQYFEELNDRFQKHYDNFGRFNLSVADSSFDTWLDGYVPGVPNRKTSIYDEGAICALIADLKIRKATDNNKSLDDVMRALYKDFALAGKGYSEKDYKMILEEVSGISFEKFINNYINGVESYAEEIKEVLDYAGLELVKEPAKTISESLFGFRTMQEGGATKITAIAPGSVADRAGLSKDDEIQSIKGFKVENNLNDWLNYFAGETIELKVISLKQEKLISLKASRESYYPKMKVSKLEKLSKEQKEFFRKWLNLNFD